MKLKFIEKDSEISTKIVKDEVETDFSYIEFIECLYNGVEMEEPIYEGNFTNITKNKLREMLERINEIVASIIKEAASCNED